MRKIINKKGMILVFLTGLLVLLTSFLVSGYHDSVPAGQHMMPNGQLMNNADMMSPNEKAKSSLWFILLFVAVIGIVLWWMANSNKKVN